MKCIIFSLGRMLLLILAHLDNIFPLSVSFQPRTLFGKEICSLIYVEIYLSRGKGGCICQGTYCHYPLEPW
jgi:hypothetical protein